MTNGLLAPQQLASLTPPQYTTKLLAPPTYFKLLRTCTLSLRYRLVKMVTRRASHAGSWYTNKGPQLSQQLDGWLADVPSSITPVGTVSSQAGDVSVPTPNARAIIGP